MNTHNFIEQINKNYIKKNYINSELYFNITKILYSFKNLIFIDYNINNVYYLKSKVINELKEFIIKKQWDIL